MQSLAVCQIRHTIKGAVQYAVSINQYKFVFQFFDLFIF